MNGLNSLTDAYFRYCPGCGRAIINKIMAEVIDELDIREKAGLVWPIGCAVYANEYQILCICALHGRAPAVATGIKRAQPDNASCLSGRR